MRKNIISMLNDIKLNEFLNINDCSELFGDKDYLMHTVSFVPYPVFVKKQNYTGHTPKLLKSDFLMKYIYDNFIDEINKIDNFEDVLLIPLGSAVEEVLCKLKDENIIKENSNGLKIMASEFGRNLGAMGAAAMVMQNAFEFLEEKI